MNLLYFIPLILFLVLLFIKKYKFEKNDLINIIFWGYISTFLSLIIAGIIKSFIPNYDILFKGRNIVVIFLTAGFLEEVVKFFAIKMTKPTSKNSIFVNSIMIALAFTIIEDFGYFASYTFDALYSRLLTPMHILFQIIMALFLIKAFESRENKEKNLLFNILALAIPTILHTIYDSFITIVIPKEVAYIVGIITYIVLIAYTMKMRNEERIIENKKLNLFSIIKIIFIILSTWFLTFSFNPTTGYNELNKEVEVVEDKIYMTVEGIEEKEIKDSIFSDGTYTRVKIKIRNDSDSTKKISMFCYLIDGEKEISKSYNYFDDDLPLEIEAKKEIEGYIYFEAPYKKGYIFKYLTNEFKEGATKGDYYFYTE